MRVFVSSTYIDLRDYRSVAEKVIRNLEMEVAGLEEFGASEEGPIPISKRAIDDSDIFLLLIGTAYGYIPPGENESFVEIEYKRAKEREKPILAFFLGENVPIPQPDEPDPGTFKRVSDFKNRIASELLVTEFHTTEELAIQLETALSTYVKVVEALENPDYEWRTVSGASKEVGLDTNQVEKIIESLPNVVIRSTIPDRQGRALYTSRQHYRQTHSTFHRLRDLLRST